MHWTACRAGQAAWNSSRERGRQRAGAGDYLWYAAPRGHALIDRELYLPRSCADDPDRCAAAGIPAEVKFETKPQLARRMIGRAITAQVPFAWVAGDEVYGDNGPLRTWLEQQHIAYVLAVACDHRMPAGARRTVRADELAARLPQRAWQQLSAAPAPKATDGMTGPGPPSAMAHPAPAGC